MTQPKLLTHPWAERGLKNSIPLNREGSGVTSATATYEDGFPETTMKPINEGGKAPSGKDMNGILHEITTHIAYQNKGLLYKFEADFCAAIGGYPKGSILLSDDGVKVFISLVENNQTNFNSDDYLGKWDFLATIKELENPDGFKYIGQAESIEQLRTIEPTEDQQRILVKSYHTGKNIGGGVFYADFSDTTTADNRGTVIVTTEEKRWKRVYDNLSLYDFSYDTIRDNASQAVDNAEQAGLGEFIDCCGLTIDVGRSYPTRNKYFNGKFVINGVTVLAQYNSVRTGIGRFISGSGAAENLRSGEWTGSDITVIGEGSMGNMEKCVSAIAIGKRAQGKGTISRDNISIGVDSLYNVQAETEWYSQTQPNGTRNIGIGGNAGRGIESGYGNVAIGRNAGQNLYSGANNVVLGSGAVGGTAQVGFSGDIEHYFRSGIRSSVAIGANALNQYVAASESVAVGAYAAEKMKGGLYNTAIGFGAMRNIDADLAPNGGRIVWQGTQGGAYVQEQNTITLTFSDLHGCEVGHTIGLRLLDGEAKTLMGDIVPCVVQSKSGNTVTVASSKSLSTSGSAELRYVYNQEPVKSTANQNTAIGFAAINEGKTVSYSVAVGTSALKKGDNTTGSVAIGASAFEHGTHTNSIAIGRLAGNRGDSTNSIIIGTSTLRDVPNINNSIILGNNLNPRVSELNNKLAIGDGFIGDMAHHRYGINVPPDTAPLANLHIRTKGDAGTGRTTISDGLLIEHSSMAVAKLDGKAGVDFDFHAGGDGVVFGIRHRTNTNLTTIITNNEHSWKINRGHAWIPDADNRNSFGSSARKLKEIFLEEPGSGESGDKVITAKWFRNQFSQQLESQNGWCKLPNGIIEQWGWTDMSDGVSSISIDFPIAFNECFFVIPIDITNRITAEALAIKDKTNTGFTITAGRYAGGVAWFARGK